MNKYTVENFIKEIGLSDEAQVALSDYALLKTEEEGALKELFYRDFSAFVKAVDGMENAYMVYLYLYCSLAVDTYYEYQKRGYAHEVFVDTFRDFSVWCDVCLTETGKIGLKETEWLREPLLLKIFKLGALQFQPETLEEDYPLTDGQALAKGTTIYHLHIRQGTPFSPEAVDASLKKAKEFFGLDEMICFCESWFLSPTLQKILRADSNILHYQDRFTLLETDKKSRSCERYIFGKFEEDFSLYAPKNRLGERVLELLKNGEAVGEATGFFKI